jgi:hypothetical protein
VTPGVSVGGPAYDRAVATLATQPTDADVDAFLARIPDERRRADAIRIRGILDRVTGANPVMWGASIVGYGSRSYRNTTGEYDWLVVGFSPRSAALTIYGVYDDYAPADPLYAGLGPHTTGKGCLYVKRVDAIDLGVLERLVAQAWARAGV